MTKIRRKWSELKIGDQFMMEPLDSEQYGSIWIKTSNQYDVPNMKRAENEEETYAWNSPPATQWTIYIEPEIVDLI